MKTQNWLICLSVFFSFEINTNLFKTVATSDRKENEEITPMIEIRDLVEFFTHLCHSILIAFPLIDCHILKLFSLANEEIIFIL